MRAIYFFILLVPAILSAQNPTLSSKQYQDDFDFFWKTVQEEYCYFDKKQTDWKKVKTIYSAANVTNRDQFISLLEKALYEIYDHHASLNTNIDLSQKLVPAGTDIWAEYSNSKAVITEVRQASNAEKTGLLAGMQISAVNDIPIDEAIKPFLAKSTATEDNEMKSYALRVLLAGNHIQQRKITIKHNGKTVDFYPDKDRLLKNQHTETPKLETSIEDGTGYIKINDCLYDNELIPEFDSAMQKMKGIDALILDLRNTPSGGNTTVARAIMGWFIDKDHFYQKHEYTAEAKLSGIKRSWVEIVSPRTDRYYAKPLVILADHWTGSVGEGITVGFDGFERPKTKIIGTTLARLNGAVYTFEMPNTKIKFTFPVEKLFHINGTPREFFEPAILIDLTKEKSTGSDLFIMKAKQYIDSAKK